MSEKKIVPYLETGTIPVSVACIFTCGAGTATGSNRYRHRSGRWCSCGRNSVCVKGTTTGTNTNAQGKYTISATSADVLSFSFIGYITQEVTVGNRQQLM